MIEMKGKIIFVVVFFAGLFTWGAVETFCFQQQ